MKWSEVLAVHEKASNLNPDCLIFIRVNGGYEAFGHDAYIVADACNTGTYKRLDTVASHRLSARQLGQVAEMLINKGHKLAVVEPTTGLVSGGNGNGRGFSEEAGS